MNPRILPQAFFVTVLMSVFVVSPSAFAQMPTHGVAACQVSILDFEKPRPGAPDKALVLGRSDEFAINFNNQEDVDKYFNPNFAQERNLPILVVSYQDDDDKKYPGVHSISAKVEADTFQGEGDQVRLFVYNEVKRKSDIENMSEVHGTAANPTILVDNDDGTISAVKVGVYDWDDQLVNDPVIVQEMREGIFHVAQPTVVAAMKCSYHAHSNSPKYELKKNGCWDVNSCLRVDKEK